MSTGDPEHTGQGDVVVSGSIGALRDLAEPYPPLTELQLQIIRWFTQLVNALDGPRSGSERGPAQAPSWTQQPPRVERVEPGIEEEAAYRIWGSGLESTFAVWINGRPMHGWRVEPRGWLLVPQPLDPPQAVEILIRTRQGDAVAHYDRFTD
jgi:hypothetical protein